MKSWMCLVSFGLIVGGVGCAQAEDLGLTYHGIVADGGQIDALPGRGETIHLLSSKYYQFDLSGNKLLEEEYGDGRQGSLDFPPALALGPKGAVHTVTRHNGSWNEGHDIVYRKRDVSGSWSAGNQIGGREKRNYVVGVAAGDSEEVHMLYTRAGDDVGGNILLWRESGGFAEKLGELAGIWRADADARIRGRDGRIFFTSGKPDYNGAAYYSHCAAGPGCYAELKANMQDHRAGAGRRGVADLYIDGQGDVHLTYGTQYSVYYNRYAQGTDRVFADDVQVFGELGEGPFIGIGISAVAATDTGELIASVAMENETGELLLSISADQGENWSEAVSLGVFTEGGETRRRPRMVAKDNNFYLFYYDTGNRAINLISFDGEKLLAEAPDEPVLTPMHLLLM